MIRTILKRIVVRLHRIFMRRMARLHYCHGSEERLHLGERVSTMNTLVNVASGDIHVGDLTIFGHNCMVITGRHEYVGGKRGFIATGQPDAPPEGYNIRIGSGCWIASGSIISGSVSIGDNTIIGAGSVVTRDIPADVFAAGVPARVIRRLEETSSEPDGRH